MLAILIATIYRKFCLVNFRGNLNKDKIYQPSNITFAANFCFYEAKCIIQLIAGRIFTVPECAAGDGKDQFYRIQSFKRLTCDIAGRPLYTNSGGFCDVPRRIEKRRPGTHRLRTLL